MTGVDIYTIGILKNELPSMSKSNDADPMLNYSYQSGDANRLQAQMV